MEETKRLRTLLQTAIEVMAVDSCYEMKEHRKRYILNGLGVSEEELAALGIDLEEAIKC